MSITARRQAGTVLAIACVMLAALVELLIREQFYRMSVEVPAVIQVLACWFVLTYAVLLIAGRHRWVVRSALAVRVCVLLAVAVSTSVLLPLGTAAAGWSGWVQLAACASLAVVGSQMAHRVSAATWRRLLWAISIGSLLFVSVQPVLVAARAPFVSWPAWPKPEDAKPSDDPAKSAQVFLLLDELNASAAGPIAEALGRSNLPIKVLSLSAAGNGTAKVVPSMFTGGNFEQAKACGTASTCGSVDVLDFSKVTASRDDVDVVGFYMPYCAIKGLRFCVRSAMGLPLSDWRLWACAAFRRVDHFPATMVDHCTTLQRDRWQQLRSDVESAMWQAPVWSQGGFLYAHLPLPHPPAGGRSASLKDDYAANVAEAARLVTRIVATARARNVHALSLVIFSDHPLRPRHYCAEPVYFRHPCDPNDQLNDSFVPLIVAGNPLPDTHSIQSNKEVFSLHPSVGAAAVRQL